MTGPFDGVTVVEFGQFVVVPFCSQMMADGGARVIKVEPPGGDAYRSWPDQIADGETLQFLIKNRGKQSLALDLSHPRAPEVVAALVEEADVVLVNLSPAAVVRRGLDYASIAAINPTVIYGAVTAYGQVGPEAHLPGMDVVVQARSGLLSALGAEKEGVPLHSEVQVADYSTAMLMFGGIASALYVRERTGRGQRVDVSLLGGALAIQNNSLGHVHDRDQWRVEFVEDRLPKLRQAGASRLEVESERRSMRHDPPSHTAHYRIFRTADGFLALGAGSPGARRRLAASTGMDPEMAAADPDRFGEQLEIALRDRGSDEWVALLLAAEVPVAKVRHVEELLFDEHAEQEGLIADIDHPVVGRYRGLGTPIRMSATPMLADRPPPAFAADTVDVLTRAGLSTSDVQSLVTDGAVIDGSPSSTPNESPRSQ